MNTIQFLKDVDRLEYGEGSPPAADGEQNSDLTLARLLFRHRSEPTLAYQHTLRCHLLRQLYAKEEEQMSKHRLSSLFQMRWAKAFTAFCLVFLVIVIPFWVSPVARAAAGQWFNLTVREVDNLFSIFGEMPPLPPHDGTEPPHKNGGSIMVVHSKIAPEGSDTLQGNSKTADNTMEGDVSYQGNTQTVEGALAGNSPVGYAKIEKKIEIFKPEKLTLEEAQQHLDFPIRTPAYLPDGYRYESVMLPPPLPDTEPKDAKVIGMKMVSLHYTDPQDNRLTITQHLMEGDIENTQMSMEMLVGKGSVQQVSINGQLAQFIIGAWKHDGTWDMNDASHTLTWSDTEGRSYEILANQLPLEEMVLIAESLK
jgi:hypothetical protein